MKDGGALRSILPSRVGELAIESNGFDRSGIEEVVLHVADPLLHAPCPKGDPHLEPHAFLLVAVKLIGPRHEWLHRKWCTWTEKREERWPEKWCGKSRTVQCIL